MQIAIKYFTIFGGLDIKIDTTVDIEILIEEKILKEYENFRKKINSLTGGYKIDHAVLSGIALGDRKTTTAFKRAHVSFEEGMKSIENLVDKGIIELESSKHFLSNKRSTKVAQKLIFTTPFLRFWFAFVSPIYKGIKDNDFKEFYSKYSNKKSEFSDFIFEELALEYIDTIFEDDAIVKLGKYWDDICQIDLIAKTKSGKIIAGNCKYSNSKIKTNDLNKLKSDCEDSKIKADIFVLFSKKGYTNELKSQKDETLRLFTVKSFKLLLK